MSIALSLESGSIPITHISTSTCAPASPLAVHAALEEADATATLEDQLRELAMLRRASSRASTAARSQKLETAVEALDRLQPQQHKSQPSLRSCYLYNSEPPDSWIPSDNVETGSVISIPMDFVAMNPLPLSRSRYTAAPASPSSPRIGSPIARSINDMRYPGNLRWTEASAHYPIDQVQQQPAMLPSSPPPLPPKSRPVARAMYKIRRSFSALGAMFRHHGHGGGSEAETNYTQRFPSSVVPRPRAGTSGGASRRSRLYESRCSMVIKDVSPETAAEILAPGSSYAQVLASLVDRKSVDGRSVRVSTSSRISMSTVFVQSEAGDDTDSDDKDGYQGAKQMASTFVTGGHSHISNPPTPHSADTKTLKRQVGGGVSVRTALRVDTTIKVQLRRSMSEPHMTPRHSSSRANDSLPSPLIPRSQIERVPWKALGHAASFSDLDADSSSFRASSKATASRGRQRPWKVLWRRLGAGGFRPYVQ
ncbi:hypothetical protein BDZ88DRAFT_425227 [Geranomyces variabilis]|nr:hypothetical protein BDZ88DRAFT_425227 [Geranomyces variabilis]KAJ3143694.1 hypothetical protein HDU90_000459 [Geranomyces variabilis]